MRLEIGRFARLPSTTIPSILVLSTTFNRHKEAYKWSTLLGRVDPLKYLSLEFREKSQSEFKFF